MDNTVRCQSCGMPLGPGFFGTDAEGNEMQEYCKFCYMNGAFTKPDMIVEEMIRTSVSHMMDELNIPEEKAQEMARTTIPQLKRWQQ